MTTIFGFGEKLDGYAVPVLNEREVRASAGILFFFAMVSFMNAWLVGDFRLTRIFVVAFLIDFSIRIFVNPRYSPSIVLGRFAVRHQVPEYVGAPQKRFAWGIGLALAIAMLYLVVINNIIGPINLLICSTCLLLLFFEAAFGICLGCKIYNLFSRNEAQLCPGGTCETTERKDIQKIGFAQTGVVAVFLLVIVFVGMRFTAPTSDTVQLANPAPPTGTASGKDCTPPEWAVAMGHADKWKLHNNCR